MFGYNSPRYGAWSLDPYNVPTVAGIAMNTAKGIGGIQDEFAQVQARQLQNALTKQTMPEQIEATNAQNSGVAQTAVPNALAGMALNQFKAANPLVTMPGTAGQIGAIQSLRDPNNPAMTNPALAGLMQYGILLGQQNQLANINWKNSLTNSMPIRYAPTLTKLQIQEQLQQQGYPPAVAAQIAANAPQSSNIATTGTTYPQYIQGQNGVPQNALQGGNQTASTQNALGTPAVAPPQMVPQDNGTQTMINWQNGIPSVNMQPAQNALNGQQPAQGAQNPAIAPQQLQNVANQAKQAAGETASEILTKTQPAAVRQQAYYSQIAGNLYNNASQYIPAVANYANAGGSFDKLVDTLSTASGGKPSPDYNNLLQFKAQVPVIANEVRRQLGGQATDSETKIMDQLVDPNLWNKSPQEVLTLWNNLGNIVNTTGSVLKENQAQINSTLGTEANTGSQNTQVNIPSFNSKEEAQTWFKQQSPDVQSRILAQMGNK
jgi:hypothetical protein